MTTSNHDTTGTPADPYAEEARQRWGHTDAYKQSQERVKKLSKDDLARIGKESEELTRQIAAVADHDPADPVVQALIARHYAGLRHLYEPNAELYRGLADMYVADERFAAHYDKYVPGLAMFMRDAMHAYCDANQNR